MRAMSVASCVKIVCCFSAAAGSREESANSGEDNPLLQVQHFENAGASLDLSGELVREESLVPDESAKKQLCGQQFLFVKEGATYNSVKNELKASCTRWNYEDLLCNIVIDELFMEEKADEEFNEKDMCKPMLDLIRTHFDHQATMGSDLARDLATDEEFQASLLQRASGASTPEFRTGVLEAVAVMKCCEGQVWQGRCNEEDPCSMTSPGWHDRCPVATCTPGTTVDLPGQRRRSPAAARRRSKVYVQSDFRRRGR